MSKISVSFLVGFALVVGAGAASAEGNADAAAMSNSVASQVMSMDGLRSQTKLSEAKAANPLSQAASSLTSASAGSGTGIDIPSVQAKIGSGTSLSLPGNALMDTASGASGSVANALQGTQATGTDDLKTTVVLGSNMADVSNVIGEGMRSSQRLGK